MAEFILSTALATVLALPGAFFGAWWGRREYERRRKQHYGEQKS